MRAFARVRGACVSSAIETARKPAAIACGTL